MKVNIHEIYSSYVRDRKIGSSGMRDIRYLPSRKNISVRDKWRRTRSTVPAEVRRNS